MTKAELSELQAKADILKDAGYYYKFDRRMYVNRREKKAFSIQFLYDHPVTDVEARVMAASDGVAWRFYFNADPSPSVRQQLELALA